MRQLVIGLWLALSFTTTAFGQGTNRIVDDIDLSVHAGYADVTLQLTCTLRYLSHLPSSEGDLLRIRLMPQSDCQIAGEGLATPLIPGVARSIIAAVELDRSAGAEVQLLIRWRKKEHFLVMPDANGKGVRIRVLGTTEAGRVLIGEQPAGRSAIYAINLDSSRTAFDNAATDTASKLGVRVYVSEADIDGEHWYRLRAGPFVSEKDAQRSLLAVRERYPQAWLAIGDDETLNNDIKQPMTSAIQAAPRLAVSMSASERAEVLQQARIAFKHKDYATALPLLTKLLEQPEFAERAEMQELLGLAHERSKHIAHAKAEYEEYLRRYPSGPAVERVRQRLRALNLAARKSVPGLHAGDESDSPWKMYGGFSQFYRRDDMSVETGTTAAAPVSQSALLNDVSWVARRRGERYDFSSRVGASYIKNLSSENQSGVLGDQTRVSAAVVELSDRELGWRARVGRQSVSGSGVYGTFDGVYADYQWQPKLRVSLTAGAPLDFSTASSTKSSSGNRRLIALATNLGPFANAWDFTTYATTQRMESEVDRRAVGTEIHYFVPGRTLIALVDYDLYFHTLNDFLLIGTLQLPKRWMLNANVDHRRSPSLSIRNALIGQTLTSLDDLLMIYTSQELQQLAIDRSAPTDLFSLSASVAAGEHWQWTFDVSRISVGETVASGGVQAMPAIAPEMAYTVLAIGNGVIGARDLELITLRYQSAATFKTTSLSLSSRWPIAQAWRIGPRVRVDQRQWVLDGTTQWIYLPGLRLEYLRRTISFELEAGVELSKHDVSATTEKSTRKYFSAGYRWQF